MIEMINIADVGGLSIAAWISICGLIVHKSENYTLSKILLGVGIFVLACITAIFIYLHHRKIQYYKLLKSKWKS